MSEALQAVALAYAIANIGLLTGIFFRLGKVMADLEHGKARFERQDERLANLEGA
jgi:hypothetical protein